MAEQDEAAEFLKKAKADAVTEASAEAFNYVASCIRDLSNEQIMDIAAHCMALGRTLKAEMERRHLVESDPAGNG
jgi:hypothetical protein